MNRHQSKMNFAAKTKARGFATMGAGFVDQMETLKMEERLQLMKKTMELEREERKNRGGQFWKSGQKGKLTTYANTILQSKLSNKKVGKVKMLTDEQLNLPNRNETASLSKKLSDISNNSIGTVKPSSKNNMRLCGQCESTEAALCCIQCTEVYCTACFSAYHKKGALRKHRSISLEVSSTPRSKPPNFDKRLSDLSLISMEADMTSEQSDSLSPSGASGVFKKDEEEAAVSSLMDGNYNEAESAASFQEALLAWRTNTQSSGAAGAAAVASIGAATSVANATEIPSSQPKPKKNEGIYTNSSTSTMERPDNLASLMDKTQNHTLSYAERLLVKKNRRTPIFWELDPLDATDPSESKDNSEQMKTWDTEETSSVLDSAEIPERLSVDEPVTFSSLYHLVAQDNEESDKSSTYEEEILPGTYKNVQNELPQKPKVSQSPTENFPHHSSSVVPLVQSFPEKRPGSSASQSGPSISKSGKKTPRRVQTPKKQRPKSRTSSSVSRSTNLTTAPSEGLQMVCQLAKSQHGQNNGQQPSLLMVGLSSDATGNTDEVNPSERHSSLKSNTGVTRPATTVKVSYTLYKMSPCSWHPERSISQNLSDNHPSDSLSDKSRLGGNDTQSNPTSVDVQRSSAFDSPQNTIKPASSTHDESAMRVAAKQDRRASGNLTAKSPYNQGLRRSATTLGVTSDSLQMMIEPAQVLHCLNNNAIPQDAKKYDPIPPNSLAEEQLAKRSPTSIHPVISSLRNKTVSPILTDSTTFRSKTMSPITTIHKTNEDHSGTPIYSRSTPRIKSMSPDPTIEKQKDGFGTPVHSVKLSPRSKTIYPIPSEINSEENVSPVLSLKSSAASLYSIKDTRRDKIESPIPTIIDARENLSDTPIPSVINTPRSYTMSSISMIIERQPNRSVTPPHSIKCTPRSKTMSTIHALQETQEKRCNTPVYSVTGTLRCESMSPIRRVPKTQVKSSDTPTSSLTEIDTEESVSGTPLYSPRSKSASPISNVLENLCETPVHSLRSLSSCKTASSIATVIEIQENGSATSVYSVKGTPRNKTESPISTVIDTQESIPDTLVPSVSSMLVSPIPTIIDTQESISDTLVHSVRSTPMSPIPTIIDTQESISDTLVHSVRSTPIPTIIDTQESISDTLVHSVRSTPMSPIPTIIDTQESISDTLSHSVRSTPMSPIPTIIDTQESISDTLSHSVRSTPMSPIPTIIDTQESISDTLSHSVRSTPMSPIPTIIDTQESISDTLVHSVKSTPMSPIIEKQLNCSVTPVPSTRDTPRTQKSEVTTASFQTKCSPISNHEDKDKEESLQYNAIVYQMLVNKELDSYTPDSTDHIVPLLPTATDQNKNTINPEGPSSLCTASMARSTETAITSSYCTPISSGNTTLPSPSTYVIPTSSSGSAAPFLSGGKIPLHDKLATTFYMCNSELYNADNSPIHPGAKLKKGPASTKKYVIRRPPEIPDGTELQKTNSPRDDNLQPKSASPSNLSVLEMKRIQFKQSNKVQNVSLEEKPNSEQSDRVPDLSRLSLSLSEELNGSAEDDHESVFSSLTKMSVDSLDEEPCQSLTFNEEDFLIGDDLQAEIDEIEDQIAEEMKVKALK